MGGDFNDIKSEDEKRGGRERQESSFQAFRTFLDKLEIGDTYTWANNREGEGFMQERLDSFYGSIEWML